MSHSTSCHCLAAVFVLTILMTSGCTSLCSNAPRAVSAVGEESPAPREGWWNVRFKIQWPDVSEEPSWYVDALLADRIVGPVLSRYRKDVSFWRFHRRAADDDSGHQFSLIFYSTPKTANKIYKAIGENSLLEGMKARGLIVRVACDDTNGIGKPGVEDMSDRHWSPSIQKSWPHFIMGVSEMWLDLIHRIAVKESETAVPSSPEGIQDFYRDVNTRVEELWRKEGGHALLHHLNAIFGYEPVAVRGKGLLSF